MIRRSACVEIASIDLKVTWTKYSVFDWYQNNWKSPNVIEVVNSLKLSGKVIVAWLSGNGERSCESRKAVSFWSRVCAKIIEKLPWCTKAGHWSSNCWPTTNGIAGKISSISFAIVLANCRSHMIGVPFDNTWIYRDRYVKFINRFESTVDSPAASCWSIQVLRLICASDAFWPPSIFRRLKITKTLHQKHWACTTRRKISTIAISTSCISWRIFRKHYWWKRVYSIAKVSKIATVWSGESNRFNPVQSELTEHYQFGRVQSKRSEKLIRFVAMKLLFLDRACRNQAVWRCWAKKWKMNRNTIQSRAMRSHSSTDKYFWSLCGNYFPSIETTETCLF